MFTAVWSVIARRQAQDGQGRIHVLALPSEVPRSCPSPGRPAPIHCAHADSGLLFPGVSLLSTAVRQGRVFRACLWINCTTQLYRVAPRPFLTWPLHSEKPGNFVGLWSKICGLSTTQQDSWGHLFSRVSGFFSLSLHYPALSHSGLCPLFPVQARLSHRTSSFPGAWVSPLSTSDGSPPSPNSASSTDLDTSTARAVSFLLKRWGGKWLQVTCCNN